MKKQQELNSDDRFYVNATNGLRVRTIDSTLLKIPKGTTIRIIVATNDFVRLTIEGEDSAYTTWRPSSFLRNCKPERRRVSYKTGYDYPTDIGEERRAELLDEDDDKCQFRETDIKQDVRFLMMEAVIERLEKVKTEFEKRLNDVFNPEQE